MKHLRPVTKMRLAVERVRQLELVSDLVDPFVGDGAAALAIDLWSVSTDRHLIGLGPFDEIIALEVHAISECKGYADTEIGVVRLRTPSALPLRR
jgi:hypothetical protein